MGYESRLYVVDKHCENYGEVIAMFNLCAIPSVSTKMMHYPKTNLYIYAEDGGTKIIKDCYGKPLTEIPIKDAISIIEEAAADSSYRRFEPCLNMLKGFELNRWHNLVVLHYGY